MTYNKELYNDIYISKVSNHPPNILNKLQNCRQQDCRWETFVKPIEAISLTNKCFWLVCQILF